MQVEVDRNDSILQAEIGERSLTFCYPFNSYNEDVLRIASKDRIGTRTKQYAIGGEKSKSTVESLDKWVKELFIALLSDSYFSDWHATNCDWIFHALYRPFPSFVPKSYVAYLAVPPHSLSLFPISRKYP